MKYSSTLLKKFISIDDDVSNIAQNLILKTWEIEEIIERKISDDVVIGYVAEVKKHPDADRLVVCQLDCGDRWQYQIVTGGVNIVVDKFVAVAVPGCYLSAIDLKIEWRKMRWLESNWMVCSKEELGILEDMDQHWIWLLEDDFDDLTKEDIGTPLCDKYAWLHSFVYDVDNKSVTHRPDLTGHWGLATELNSIYSVDNKSKIRFNKVPEYYQTFVDTNILEILQKAEKSNKKIVSESDTLRSYILIEIDNVDVVRSSFYTRVQLLDLWLQPKNNWVDFSNLFTIATGQPVHFFDADLVEWNVIVRYANKWERFVDLFDVEHVLIETDMVISDEKKILALAWVIGWKNSGVTDSTKKIIVEIANFDPIVVRKTGTRLWLRTDSELRYEKNINPQFSVYSMILFMDLIDFYKKDLWDFVLWGLDYFVENEIFVSKHIDINLNKLMDTIFGWPKDGFSSKAKQYLEWIWFEVNDGGDNFVVKVPFWRGPGDINIFEDVCEEVARLYGYEHVDSASIQSDIVNVPYFGLVKIQRELENYLVRDAAFEQVETYPRVDNKLLKLWSVDTDQLYSLLNPINVDAPFMRNALRENLSKIVAKNSKFEDDIRVFDIGKIWKKGSQIEQKSILDPRYASNTVAEMMQLWGFIYQKQNDNWSQDSFLESKMLVSTMLYELWLDVDVKLKITEYASYHPKKQADIYYHDVLVGFVGSIHPLVLKDLKISERASVAYFSMYLQDILTLLDQNKDSKSYSFETMQDQIVWRDLCFVVDMDQDFKDIFDVVDGIKAVQDYQVFDLYAGWNLPEWKKSVAFKFKIVWDGNMTTEQINEVMDRVIRKVKKVGGELRS